MDIKLNSMPYIHRIDGWTNFGSNSGRISLQKTNASNLLERKLPQDHEGSIRSPKFTRSIYSKCVLDIRPETSDDVVQVEAWVDDVTIHVQVITCDPTKRRRSRVPRDMHLATTTHGHLRPWRRMISFRFNKCLQLDITWAFKLQCYILFDWSIRNVHIIKSSLKADSGQYFRWQ